MENPCRILFHEDYCKNIDRSAHTSRDSLLSRCARRNRWGIEAQRIVIVPKAKIDYLTIGERTGERRPDDR